MPGHPPRRPHHRPRSERWYRAGTNLTEAEVTALLRVTATGPLAEDSCTTEQVAVALTGFDAAMGHRYVTVEARNTSDVPCTLTGYSGIGARGEWGDTFLLAAEQTTFGVGSPR